MFRKCRSCIEKVRFFQNKRRAGTLAKVSVAAMALAIVMTPSLHAYADDLFKGGKTTINDTFGSGSTVVWIVYIMEILSAAYAYMKTKNLAVFGGIAAVMVFINVVFGIIPG